MSRLSSVLAALILIFSLSACGQSGPLYLPGNPSEIQSDPGAAPPSQQTDEDEDEDEDEKPE